MIILLFSCEKKRSLGEENIEYIKQKYTVEAINYFYEAFFHIEGNKDNKIKKALDNKWNRELYIYLEGELWKNDSSYVRSAIKQINSLNIPIKSQFTTNKKQANVFVYFGDYDYIRQKLDLEGELTFLGRTITYFSRKQIDYVKIGIVNDAVTYKHRLADSSAVRKNVILEEVTQSLAAISDSWSHYNSLFFEGCCNISAITELDKHIIELFYEPCIPSGYSREAFEKDFGDILYNQNTTTKIKEYIAANDIDKNSIQYIRDHYFMDSVLLKFPDHIFVKLEGEYILEDSLSCKEMMEYYSSVIENVKIQFVTDEYWNELPRINIKFEESELTEEFFVHVPRGIQPFYPMMYPMRLLGSMKIQYSLKEQERRKYIDAALYDSFYKLLICNEDVKDIYIKTDSAGKIKLKPECEKALSLAYQPIFYNGMKIEKTDEILKD